MPNHITNKVLIIGSESDVEAVRSFMDVEESGENDNGASFNFNQIARTPPELLESSSPLYKNEGECEADFRRRQIGLIAKYGVDNWFDWQCQAWGTKWNAYEVSWSDNNNVVEFQTAWSTPEPIIRSLSEKFTKVRFIVLFVDEDTGSNCGFYMAQGGEVIRCSAEDEGVGTEFAVCFQNEDLDALLDGYGYDTIEEMKKEFDNDDYVDSLANAFKSTHPLVELAKLANTDSDAEIISDFIKNATSMKFEQIEDTRPKSKINK